MPPNYDAGYSNTQNQGLGGFYDPTAYTDSSYAQDKSMKPGGGVAGGNEFEDEPPLLEGKLDLASILSTYMHILYNSRFFSRTGHQSESHIPKGKLSSMLLCHQPWLSHHQLSSSWTS